MRTRPLPSTDTRLGAFTAHDAQLTAGRLALAHAVDRRRIIGCTAGSTSRPAVGRRRPDAERNRFAIRSAAATLATHGAAASHALVRCAGRAASLGIARPAVRHRSPAYTGDAHRCSLHRASLDGLVSAPGVPRTRIARTILDIAREHGSRGRSSGRRRGAGTRHVDEDALMRCARFCEGWPGIRRAYHTIAIAGRPVGVAARVGEPAATRRTRHPASPSRRPISSPSTASTSDGSTSTGRSSAWPAKWTGRSKYRLKPEDVMWREKRRQELLEDVGLVFARWGRPDLDEHAEAGGKGRKHVRARASRRPASDRLWVARSSIAALPRQCTWIGRHSVPTRGKAT